MATIRLQNYDRKTYRKVVLNLYSWLIWVKFVFANSTCKQSQSNTIPLLMGKINIKWYSFQGSARSLCFYIRLSNSRPKTKKIGFCERFSARKNWMVYNCQVTVYSWSFALLRMFVTMKLHTLVINYPEEIR